MKLRVGLVLTIGILAGACGGKETTQQRSPDSLSVDTSAFVISGSPVVALDSTVYIGPAEYLPDTREFYISLYYRQEGDNYIDPEQLDSAILETENFRRTRLPLKDAKREFYMEELDHVLIFNSENKFLGRHKLARAEYIEDEVSAQFAAVYPAVKLEAKQDDLFYAVSSNFSPIVEDFQVQQVENAELNNSIINDLHLNPKAQWAMTHQQVLPQGHIYSTVSTDTSSYLVETFENRSTVMQEGNEFHFGNIVPLPINVYGKPLIIVYFYIPEGDVTGSFLSAFNGTLYESASYNRIELKLLK